MRHGLLDAQWRQTAEHVALHLTIHSDPKKRRKAWSPNEVNSYRLALKKAEGGYDEEVRGDITMLKGLM